MSELLLICSLIMLSCVFVNVFSGKFGMPALLLFMGLGMVFGSDGLFKIDFADYGLLQNLSTLALVFIIFYGGFCTKWETAKPVIKEEPVPVKSDNDGKEKEDNKKDKNKDDKKNDNPTPPAKKSKGDMDDEIKSKIVNKGKK